MNLWDSSAIRSKIMEHQAIAKNAEIKPIIFNFKNMALRFKEWEKEAKEQIEKATKHLIDNNLSKEPPDNENDLLLVMNVIFEKTCRKIQEMCDAKMSEEDIRAIILPSIEQMKLPAGCNATLNEQFNQVTQNLKSKLDTKIVNTLRTSNASPRLG